MTSLLIAVGVGILTYVLFVIAVPKAVPKESDDYLRDAINRLAEENQAHEQSRQQVLRDQLDQSSWLVKTIFALPIMRPIYEVALQAGYQLEMQKILVIMLLGFGVGAAATLLLHFGACSLLVGLLLGYYAPYAHCTRKLKRRNSRFIDHFPDALDMIVRSVRSGFPLSVALQMVAENAEEPLRSEFRQVTDEVSLGRTLNDALARLATRIEEPDLRFFVVVLTVQQETGGNLAEIVGNLSTVIRKRKQIRHKIRALTSEGKATGWVLGSLPVLVFAALYFLQPDYLDPFFHDPLGMQLFAAVIALLISCFFVVKQMIRVDI